MKLRWRKRPSATVLHFNVLMAFGSALPLAISSWRPCLSMGARQPVRAVFATAWFMSFLLSLFPSAIQTVLFYARAMPRVAPQKNSNGFSDDRMPEPSQGASFAQKPVSFARILSGGEGTERSFHSTIAVGFGAG